MLTGRSNGMGYEKRKEELEKSIRGWVTYFKYADAKTALSEMDGWLRRRIRMCIWKSWKKPKTRIRNLIGYGIPEYTAHAWGYCKGYWRMAGAWIMTRSLTNDRLRREGYTCLMDVYCRVHY